MNSQNKDLTFEGAKPEPQLIPGEVLALDFDETWLDKSNKHVLSVHKLILDNSKKTFLKF